MAEAVDQGRVKTRAGSRSSGAFDFHQPIASRLVDTERPREVPARALAGATASWLGIVFGVCYVGLPLLVAALGLFTTSVGNFLLNTMAFVPTAMLTTLMVAVIRPQVVTSARAPRDPVIAAMLGSLLVWFVAHEASPMLQPLTAMAGVEALTFTALNVIEAGMIGMMLASFTRSAGQAFALGAAMQTLMTAFFLAWFI